MDVNPKDDRRFLAYSSQKTRVHMFIVQHFSGFVFRPRDLYTQEALRDIPPAQMCQIMRTLAKNNTLVRVDHGRYVTMGYWRIASL